MRHKGIDRAQMGARVLAAAGRAFRKNGFSGIGIDGLAKEAGVTSGAFYSHFGSKRGAFLKALEAGLDEVLVRLPQLQMDAGENWVKAFAEYYLNQGHRRDLECGCAMASLTTDVVRSDKAAHMLYEKKMLAIVDQVAEGLDDGTVEERRGRAWSVLGILIGGLNVARAMHAQDSIEEIACAIRSAAVVAAGPTKAL